jgi:hypothetical protein
VPPNVVAITHSLFLSSRTLSRSRLLSLSFSLRFLSLVFSRSLPLVFLLSLSCSLSLSLASSLPCARSLFLALALALLCFLSLYRSFSLPPYLLSLISRSSNSHHSLSHSFSLSHSLSFAFALSSFSLSTRNLPHTLPTPVHSLFCSPSQVFKQRHRKHFLACARVCLCVLTRMVGRDPIFTIMCHQTEYPPVHTCTHTRVCVCIHIRTHVCVCTVCVCCVCVCVCVILPGQCVILPGQCLVGCSTRR